MSRRCYICYKNTNYQSHYHPLCLELLYHSKQAPSISFTIEDIESLATQFIKQKMGIPGVQKKLSLSLDENNHGSKRLTIVGYLGGEYILKPPTPNYPYMPEIEDLTMHLASIAGITVALHGLIPMQNGELAYITKRFDRINQRKIAAEDLCQLSGKLTENKYKGSSEAASKIIAQYSSIPGEEVLKFFELLLFCFLVGNSDMHLKNFSLITEDPSRITLSPVYDLLSTKLLISEKDDPEELALNLNGKKSNLDTKDFLNFGKSLGIHEKVVNYTIERMKFFLSEWHVKIKESFISEDLKDKYQELIERRIKKLT